MTGYGLYVCNCENATITNCSFYNSAVCDFTNVFGGGVGILYNTQYSNTGYTLELSHSNMTKCCSSKYGGGLDVGMQSGIGTLFFNHLKMFYNKAGDLGGGMSVQLAGDGDVALAVSNCIFFNGTALTNAGGGIFLYVGIQSATITLTDLQFSHNTAGYSGGGVSTQLHGNGNVTLLVSNCDFFNGNALKHDGGGMLLEADTQSANIKLKNLTFSYNIAGDSGGGISLHLSGDNSNVTLFVSDCSFFNGTALHYQGGGMYLESKAQLAKMMLNNLKLSHNKAGESGGAMSTRVSGSCNATLVISNCDFFNGTTMNNGGGFYFEAEVQSANISITLDNSTFSHNRAHGFGGGMSTLLRGNGNTSLAVSNCDFINGTALIEGGGIYLETDSQSANVVLDNVTLLHNSGGGLSVNLDGNGYVALVISNSHFINGTNLKNEGGGVSIFTAIQSAKIIIDNSEFMDNTGLFTGEVYVNVQTDKHPSETNVTFSMLNSTVYTETYSDLGVLIQGCCASVQITNTKMRFANVHFIGFAHIGSSSSNIDQNTIQMDSCQFIGSTGVPSVVYLHQVQASITNCKFSNNTSAGNGRSVVTLQLTGFNDIIHSCIISDNAMTGITLIETSGTFSGRNVIQNNRNTDGAGITLLSPAYIQIKGELHLYNNTADRHGGAILVTQSLLLASQQRSLMLLYTKVFTSTPCTLMPLVNLSSMVFFSGNRAGEGGSDLYGGILMGCDNNGSHVQHLGQSKEISWYFDTPLMKYFHFSNTDRLSSMSSDPIMVCFCNTTTNLPDCSDRTHHIQTYPGLEINTSIAIVGRYGGTSPGVVQVTAQHATLVRNYGQNETTECFQLHILLQNTSSTTALVDVRVNGGLHDWNVSIRVDILECPIGFTEISGQCQCEHNLQIANVQCDLSNTPFKFQRSGNSWFGYINKTRCVTGTTSCPFHYCNRSNVSFDIMAPDRQCVANRTGILCGQCLSHLSIMLGSNHCGTCSNWYLFLLPVFALTGIVLVAVLMFLNLSVSVGTINGLLFYANMVKLNEAFFFPNGSIPVVSQFISWLNLDLGIEVCLFNGLDGYWNTWLQFGFPSYLFLLMGGIIVGCRYSVWLCRLCGSHAVPALATLFLMSYTKILLTVTNALSMSQLPCNDSILTVWSVDGNIDYGSGKHLVLVVVSCCILVIGLVYPVLVLCAPLLERYSHKCIPQHRWNPVAKFKPLLDAYGGPYKDKYRFWTGVTLMVRLIVTVTFSFTSGRLAVINSSIITTVVVGILTFWSFTNGVYKKNYLSALEAVYLINIFLLSTVSSAAASYASSYNYQISTIVSVCLSFVVCIVTIAMHLRWNFDLKKIKRRLGIKDLPAVPPLVSVDVDNEEDRSPSASIVYGSRRGEHQFELKFPNPHDDFESSSPVLLPREPLLFD